MKKISFTFLLFFITTVFFAQKLETNKMDPASRIVEKHTSWERFAKAGEFNVFFRISQWDSTAFFDMKLILVTPSDFTITEGDELTFTLSNGEKVTLKCFKSKKTCIGCGAVTIAGSQVPGIEATYKIPPKDIEKLRSNPVLTKEQYDKHKKEVVEKISVKISGKMIENNLSEKSYSILRKAIRLVKR